MPVKIQKEFPVPPHRVKVIDYAMSCEKCVWPNYTKTPKFNCLSLFPWIVYNYEKREGYLGATVVSIKNYVDVCGIEILLK